jgi:hypothetical protein
MNAQLHQDLMKLIINLMKLIIRFINRTFIERRRIIPFLPGLSVAIFSNLSMNDMLTSLRYTGFLRQVGSVPEPTGIIAQNYPAPPERKNE